MPQLRSLDHAATLARSHGWNVDRFDHIRNPPGFAIQPCPNCETYDAIVEQVDAQILVRCPGCDDTAAILRAFYTPNGNTAGAGRIRLTSMASVKRRSVSIVPCGLNIPTGTISIICGTQGLGKSLITCYAAAELTRRGHAAIFIAEEDSAETVIKPRLEAARADLDRVYFPEVETHDELGGIVLPKDTEELATLARLAGVQLVVIDPWTNHLDVDVDKGAVRGALMPIARAARESGFAVILVAHPTKRTDGNPLSQIAHASAVSQVARSAFMLAPDPEHPAETARENPYRLLTQEKANLTETAPTIRFEIKSILLPASNDEPEVVTAAVHSAGTSMLDWAGITEQERRKTFKPAQDTEIGRCQAWLVEYIGDGEFPRPQIIEAGKDEGYSERTINRASKEIVTSTPRPPGPARWKLTAGQRSASAETLANRANRGQPMEESQKNVIPTREAHSSIGWPARPSSPARSATWPTAEAEPPEIDAEDPW